MDSYVNVSERVESYSKLHHSKHHSNSLDNWANNISSQGNVSSRIAAYHTMCDSLSSSTTSSTCHHRNSSQTNMSQTFVTDKVSSYSKPKPTTSASNVDLYLVNVGALGARYEVTNAFERLSPSKMQGIRAGTETVNVSNRIASFAPSPKVIHRTPNSRDDCGRSEVKINTNFVADKVATYSDSQSLKSVSDNDFYTVKASVLRARYEYLNGVFECCSPDNIYNN